MNTNQLAASIALFLLAFNSVQAKSTESLPGVAVQPASYFYTGKPYDADLAAYVFAFRNYDPEIQRWTSADPSGFPDGANNNTYAAIPTSQVDLLGLLALSGCDPNPPTASLNYNNNAYTISASTITPIA